MSLKFSISVLVLLIVQGFLLYGSFWARHLTNPWLAWLVPGILVVLFILEFSFTALYIKGYVDSKFPQRVTLKTVHTYKGSEVDEIKIIDISDMHDFVPSERIVKRIINEKPDIIAFTGDIIVSDTSKDLVSDFITKVSKGSEVVPLFFYVPGNHEHKIYSSNVAQQKKSIVDVIDDINDGLKEDEFLKSKDVEIYQFDKTEKGLKYYLLKKQDDRIQPEVKYFNRSTANFENETGVILFGIPDRWYFSSGKETEYKIPTEVNDLLDKLKVAGDQRDYFSILLYHRNTVIEDLKLQNSESNLFDLILGGHLHGGGLYLPPFGSSYSSSKYPGQKAIRYYFWTTPNGKRQDNVIKEISSSNPSIVISQGFLPVSWNLDDSPHFNMQPDYPIVTIEFDGDNETNTEN